MVWSTKGSSQEPLHTYNREGLGDPVVSVSACQTVWVCHERTIENYPVKKWFLACPQTWRTSDCKNKDGEIEDQEALKGYGLSSI